MSPLHHGAGRGTLRPASYAAFVAIRADNIPHSPHRAILVGASNLTRAISTVVGLTRHLLAPRPAEIFAALGHGRSYGTPSSVCGRVLPGVFQSTIWEALRHVPPVRSEVGAQTFGLITDIGNDIMYGAEPSRIAAWVEFALRQMREHDARVVMTELPVANLATLSRFRFRIAKTLLFPGRRLTLEGVARDAIETNERVREIANRYGVVLRIPREEWYGFDPIHLCMRTWPEAWSHILSGWFSEAQEEYAAVVRMRPDVRRWIALRTALPARSWWLRKELERAQPAARLRDGTLVHLH